MARGRGRKIKNIEYMQRENERIKGNVKKKKGKDTELKFLKKLSKKKSKIS